MDLNILWFILITVLFIGFFFLEGFDYGVGALVPILGKDDDERRVVLNTIGPFWDGNEVWLITAGGAMFAAFPHVYATMFSGWYLALFLILLALILRATGIEFRSQKPSLSWRKKWDAVIAISSILSAILWGVAVSNLVIGVPIDADMQYAGSFFTLLRPFCLVGGVMLALIFLYHGACYLMLKAGDQAVLERAQGVAEKLGIPMIVVTVVWVVWAFFAKCARHRFCRAGSCADDPVGALHEEARVWQSVHLHRAGDRLLCRWCVCRDVPEHHDLDPGSCVQP